VELGFPYALTLARIDPDFAKRQLAVVLRNNTCTTGPNSGLWWNFTDVNPPFTPGQPGRCTRLTKELNGGVGDVAFFFWSIIFSQTLIELYLVD
jgi:hypothetical protein